MLLQRSRWVFVDFLLGITRFLKMDFCVRENGSRWEYLVLFDFILNLENQDKKMRISFGICAKSTKEK